MARITFLMNGRWGRTGGPLSIYRFMDELSFRGHEVYVSSFVHGAKWIPGEWKRIVESDVSVGSSPIRNVVKNIVRKKLEGTPEGQGLRGIVNLTRFTRSLVKNWVESDVTIATEHRTAMAAYWLSSRTVSIYHLLHFEEIMYPPFDTFGRLYARMTYALPLYIVPNSTWLQTLLSRLYGRETPLLNHAIDGEIFRPAISPLEKYVAKKNWTVVSYFDERREWKGFAEAAEAIKRARARLASQGITISWKVYGAHAQTKSYPTEFEHLGRISTAKLAELNATADFSLMASWYESFPLPPLESMACGTVPVTSRYGTEDYAVDGKNALVFLPRKIDEIAEKLVFAIENPDRCRQMAEAGLEVVKEFTWAKATDRLEQIIADARNWYSDKPHKFLDDLNGGRFEGYMHALFSREAAVQDFSLFP